MRTENILEAIKTTLQGTTSQNGVSREQSYDISSAEIPHVIVVEGEDNVEGERAQSYIDWILNVDLKVICRGESGTSVTLLNTIRGEIHTALMTDYTLGLAYVKFIRAVTTDRPTVSVEGDMPIVSQIFSYEVHYRSNWNSLT